MSEAVGGKRCRDWVRPDYSNPLIQLLAEQEECGEAAERCVDLVNAFLSGDTEWFEFTGSGRIKCLCGWETVATGWDSPHLGWGMLAHYRGEHGQ